MIKSINKVLRLKPLGRAIYKVPAGPTSGHRARVLRSTHAQTDMQVLLASGEKWETNKPTSK